MRQFLHGYRWMKEGSLSLFVFLNLLSGCKEPLANDPLQNSTIPPSSQYSIESLGTIDPMNHPIKTIQIFSFSHSLNSVDLQLDWNKKILNYNLSCTQNQFTGKTPVPQSMINEISNNLTQSTICRKTYTPNEGEVACLAAMMPLAQIDFMDGDSLSLSPQENPICPQNIDYFCSTEDQKQFTQLIQELISLIPSCNP